MDTFAGLVSASAKPYDFQRIAQYYESRGEYDKAGDMWAACEQWARAVQLFLKVHDRLAYIICFLSGLLNLGSRV
jgi:WD repeat-containing protein 19